MSESRFLEELGLLWEMVAEAERETFTSTVVQNMLTKADILRAARETGIPKDSGKLVHGSGKTHGSVVAIDATAKTVLVRFGELPPVSPGEVVPFAWVEVRTL